MSHILHWPGVYFFYPLGNTPAVILTRDIGFEDGAELLLLGCGDPRSILFTIFNEPAHSTRQLDFTCCDVDPAILARNVLLLSMIIDGQHEDTEIIWNSFYHMKVDDATLDAIVAQSGKLIMLSKDWDSSPYKHLIRFCTDNTLPDLCRHWQLWVDAISLPPAIKAAQHAAFQASWSKIIDKATSASPACRAFGPLLVFGGVNVAEKTYPNFWKTGTTFADRQAINKASNLNPTFLYCLGVHSAFHVHYGTDPLAGFHLAPVLAACRDKFSMNIQGARDGCLAEFSQWCAAYRCAISSDSKRPIPVIRFASADALAFARALRDFNDHRAIRTSIPVAPWRTQMIVLTADYLSRSPSKFNVIDTSNLNDHVGLWNILISATPLLSNKSPCGDVLYTEFLLPGSNKDVAQKFVDSLFCDITIVSLILGITPVDFMSSFTTHSHDELNLNEMMKRLTSEQLPQVRQTMTWKALPSTLLPVFDATQLGTLLYDLYVSFFGTEDAKTFATQNLFNPSHNMMRTISTSNLVHYTRETFVQLLAIVQRRLKLSPAIFLAVIEKFLGIQEDDQSRKMDTVNAQDLWVQLYMHGLYTQSAYIHQVHRGLFSKWNHVPPAVRVILVIPRDAPGLLLLNDTTTNPLVCDMRGRSMHNIFSSIHLAFGYVTRAGTEQSPRMDFEEDCTGWNGAAPLVASFVMPSLLLTHHDPQETISIYLSLKNTMSSIMKYDSRLGPYLNLYGAKVLDRDHVHILPSDAPAPKWQASYSVPSPRHEPIGSVHSPVVTLDQQCATVESLSVKVSVLSQEAKSLFGKKGGVLPVIEPVTSLVHRLRLGGLAQEIHFPCPVGATPKKVSLARTSLYIEMIMNTATPSKPERCMKASPFPILLGKAHAPTTYNIHCVNLDTLPAMSLSEPKRFKEWLNPHLGSMLSARERKMVEKLHKKNIAPDDPLALIKYSLLNILMQTSGIQGKGNHNVFSLVDWKNKNSDTLLFMVGVKHDLSSSTVVGDGYIVPLRNVIVDGPDFPKLLKEGNVAKVFLYSGDGDVRWWKHLIPALVERCRTWPHGANCEYLALRRVPLTEEMNSNPICTCGEGKNVEEMMKKTLWKPFAQYATRVAISPLFGVTYMEPQIRRDPKCAVCRAKAQQTCSVCTSQRYCSRGCQKKDWPRHKHHCTKKP